MKKKKARIHSTIQQPLVHLVAVMVVVFLSLIGVLTFSQFVSPAEEFRPLPVAYGGQGADDAGSSPADQSTASAGDSGFDSWCTLSRLDFVRDGTVTQADLDAYLQFKDNRKPEADLNSNGSPGDAEDDRCFGYWWEQSGNTTAAIGNPLQIISPPAGSTLQGIPQLTVASSSLQSTSSVTFKYRLLAAHDQKTYYDQPRTYSVPETARTSGRLSVDLDTLSFRNGDLAVVACRDTSTNDCSAEVHYILANTFAFASPANKQSLSGSIRLSAAVSGEVSFVGFNLMRQSASGPATTMVWEGKAYSAVDGRYSLDLDTTRFEDDNYFLTTWYWSKSQRIIGNSWYFVNSHVINNAIADQPNSPGDGPNTPEPGTESPEQPSPTDNLNASADPSLPPPVIASPKNETNWYELRAVKGTANARYVSLLLNDRQWVEVPTFTTASGQREFLYTLPTPLIPGSYKLTAIAFESFDQGPHSTGTAIHFQILRPKIEVTTAEKTKLEGTGTLVARSFGPAKAVEFFGALDGSVIPSSFGMAKPVPNTSDWSLSFSARNFPTGLYRIFAVMTIVNGEQIRSPERAIQVVASPAAPAVIDQPVSKPPEPAVVPPESAPTPSPTPTPSTPTTETPPPADGTTPEVIAPVESPAPTAASAPVIPEIPAAADPRQTGVEAPEQLAIKVVANVNEPVSEENRITFSGIGPPDSIVTLYIFSNPIVITTRTDENGNWTYTLDRQLTDGGHEVYVAVTDKTGKVEQKSTALRFLVSEARAVTEEEFLRTDTSSTSGDRQLALYLALAVGFILLTVVLYLLYRNTRPRENPTGIS